LTSDGAFAVRDAEDGDAEQLIALIGGVFAEYPGCILDVEGELPELLSIATAFRAWGGRFWVAEQEGRVVGCIGARSRGGAPERPWSVELCKLYVAREARRRGLGGALCALVEEEARARGAAFVELWSDTRFKDAHRLYERRGYARGPETRELHDRSASVEHFFRLDLSGAS
jgi:putative acetyltransferase